MLTLVIARHGETTHNAAGRYQGHCDAPLTAAGIAQAHALAERIAPLISQDDVRYVSSDLGRALATAAIALPGRAIRSDRRLRETHFGRFDGQTHDECLHCDGVAYRAWLEDPIANAIPEGESFDSLEARVLSWLDEQPRHGITVAITHGGPAFILMSRLLHISFAAARRIGLEHGASVRLTLEETGV